MERIYLILVFCSLFVVNVFGQDISGIVKDEKGKGVAAVSIKALPSGKTIGVTNGTGAFKVPLPAGATSLSFVHASYESTTMSMEKGKTYYTVSMMIKTTEIEMVTVGYVARKKESLTGSAVVINADDIKDAPAASFTDLLQGRVPGMNVQLNTGTPGVRGSMSIRGLNSATVNMSGQDAYLNATSPLFVIDGIPIDEGNNFEYGFQTQGPGVSPISMIPVEDLEDITVLKDAQATALYGSKGAYGVILVTTKRGKSRIPIVSYQSKYFVNTIPSLRTVIGGMNERRMRVNQILQNDTSINSALDLINSTPLLADSLNVYYNNSTNWQSFLYGMTMNTQQSLNISGGDQSFNYKIAPGYYKENGIVKNTGFTRYSMNTNMQYRPSNSFVMSGYMNTYMVRNSFGSGNAYQQKGVASSASTTSLLPPPSIYSGSYEALASTNVLNDNKTGYVNTQLQLEYEILKGLRATSNINYTYDNANQDKFTPELLNSGESMVYIYNSRRNALYNRNMLQYNTTFGGEKHNILTYFFNEVDMTGYRAEAMKLIGTGSDNIQTALSYNSRNTLGGVLNNLSDFKSASYAGNLTYQYDSKYIMELSYRLDGSSNRGSSGLWSQNPSVGLRWNANREKFMDRWDWMSTTNIRASWGRNIVPVGTIYDAYGRYTQDPTTYNGQPTVTINTELIPNTDLQPIVTTQLNLALELGFWNDRLLVTYENYYKQVDKDLVKIALPNYSGFNEKKVNEQSVVNIGHELSVYYRSNFNNPDWKATVYANGALNKDYMADLAGDMRQEIMQHSDPNLYYIHILKRLGRNALTNVLYDYRGVYKSDEEVPVNPATGLRYRLGGVFGDDAFFRAGDPIFTDLNGDYVLNAEDLVAAGNSQPRFTGGFGATIQYKNWSFQPNFVLTIKRDILNKAIADYFRSYYNPTGSGSLLPIDQYDYWTPTNTSATYPNPFDFRRSSLVDAYRYNSTLFQEDGSYLKFNSATLSYNFKREFIQSRLGITGLRLFLTGYNLYTFSRYSGPDPELVSALGYDTSDGYPRARSFTFGLDVQF
ncbi:SusC/RagA family TonB-linked outer membrane protein [Sphingobacterium sp. SGG-5]|uniref:SusC/RagA family TonB-linked outer membrane protein n=1 Tax=Sphingobacterium sp. SGG-5 TaxID=2710881 RepID=UPI0013EAC257|nr:SusC/RagA family TonB-linked outer membrane protein [Sphingobacterium sp. SGG-5]NGM61608.1 SusC/RagA family TonB-linked outer membrane protein [Sphingobacterium sp. SGG-5]